MKNTLALFALTLASIAAYAVPFAVTDYNAQMSALWKNRSAKDQSVVSSAVAYADSVESDQTGIKMLMVKAKAVARTQTAGADQSWTAHKAYVDAQIAALNLAQPPETPQYLGALYVWWIPTWDKDIYAFMKTLPDYEKWVDAGMYAFKNGHYEEAYTLYMTAKANPHRAAGIAINKMKDPVKCFAACKMITESFYGIETVRGVIEIAIGKLSGNDKIPAAEFKAFLQSVNRKYSAKLIADEATWKPVIAQVRTILETY